MNRDDIDKKVTGSLSGLKALASSEEGKTLLSSLGEEGLESVKKAAEGIKRGDVNAMKDLLLILRNTKEGRELAKKVTDITGR